MNLFSAAFAFAGFSALAGVDVGEILDPFVDVFWVGWDVDVIGD